jgi:hypothetical protein
VYTDASQTEYVCPDDCSVLGEGVVRCAGGKVTECKVGYQISADEKSCTPCTALDPGATSCYGGRIRTCATGLKLDFTGAEFLFKGRCICSDASSYANINTDGKSLVESRRLFIALLRIRLILWKICRHRDLQPLHGQVHVLLNVLFYCDHHLSRHIHFE